MSMRVERSTLDQVKKRFEMNKRKKEEKKKDYDFEERMRELKEEVLFSFLISEFNAFSWNLCVCVFFSKYNSIYLSRGLL